MSPVHAWETALEFESEQKRKEEETIDADIARTPGRWPSFV